MQPMDVSRSSSMPIAPHPPRRSFSNHLAGARDTQMAEYQAARRLDEPFRTAHPEIPRPSLVGARNVVMHDYEYLRPERIREMAEKDVPELLSHCLRLLGGAR